MPCRSWDSTICEGVDLRLSSTVRDLPFLRSATNSVSIESNRLLILIRDIPIKYRGYLRYSVSSVSMYLDLAPSGCGFLFCRGSFIFIRYRFFKLCKILRICLPLPLQCGSFFWALWIEILLLFIHWIFFSSKNM